MGNVKFATSFYEDRPVEIAGVRFFSKRLSAQDEILLQHLSLAAVTGKAADILHEKIDIVRHVLQRRVLGDREITMDWVADHLGHVNTDLLMDYLRSGQGLKPGGTLDLPVFEALEIGGRVFTGRALNFQEQMRSAQREQESGAEAVATGVLTLAEHPEAMFDSPPEETVAEMNVRVKRDLDKLYDDSVRIYWSSAELVAEFLNSRIQDGGEPIDSAWVMDYLRLQDLQAVVAYLRDGTLPAEDEVLEQDAETEGDTPNADASA